MEGTLRYTLGSQAQHTQSVEDHTLEKSILSYITANIPNTPMQHGCNTQHFIVTTLHTVNNTVAKGFNQMAPPARTITVALDMSKAFDTKNIHTHLSESCYRATFEAQSLGSSQTTSRDAKPIQHIEITHPHNLNLKLAFHKVASFPQRYSTYTLQTYHRQEHQFRSWPTQMTSPSHLHTKARVQPRNTYCTDPHTVTTKDIKTNICHIDTFIVSRHLATRGNYKILRTH